MCSNISKKGEKIMKTIENIIIPIIPIAIITIILSHALYRMSQIQRAIDDFTAGKRKHLVE